MIPGQIFYTKSGYIEYHYGNSQLILSAPHGGSLEPEEIPDRTYGTLSKDTRTKEICIGFKDEMYKQCGRYPHIIINNLHRKKLDCNREVIEGAQGNEIAINAWNLYHAYIEYSKSKIVLNNSIGFYIDVHGQSASPYINLGYNLTRSDYSKTGTPFNVLKLKSTMQYICNLSRNNFEEILRGELKSLGSFLDNEGYQSTPSYNNPIPPYPYYTGGYGVDNHTTYYDDGFVDGVQLELYYTGIRNSTANVNLFVPHMYNAIKMFFIANYGIKPGDVATFGIYSQRNKPKVDKDPHKEQLLKRSFL